MAYTLISHLSTFTGDDNPRDVVIDEFAVDYEPSIEHGLAAAQGFTAVAVRDQLASQALAQFHLSCAKLLADTHHDWGATAFDSGGRQVATIL